MSLRLFLRFFPALLALATLAWSPASALGGDRPRPFRGLAEGVFVEQVPVSPTQVEAVIEYTGTATHLGRFTRTEWVLIDFAAGTAVGTMVYTAANGDELWLDFEGVFISENSVAGTYTFTGGTGRFADATGGATFLASTPDFVSVEAAFEGIICY